MFKVINFLLIGLVRIFFSLPFISDHTKTNKKVAELVSLYGDSGFAGMSAKIRFWDSPLEQLEKFVPKKGKVLDLGSGEGILTNYMALCQPKREMIGIEISKERTKESDKGLKNTKFIQQDALKVRLPNCNAIVMSHMLHHLPSKKAQGTLLENCHKSLKKDGQVIIAEVDKGFSLKYFLAWLTDTIIVPTLFEKQVFNPEIFHRSKNDWKEVLESLGFKIEKLQDLAGGPFPDIVIVAKKS